MCRVKNGFAAAPSPPPLPGLAAPSPAAAAADGYRDLKVYVVLRSGAAGGLRIVGEIQIHDERLHYFKLVNVNIYLYIFVCMYR